MSQKDGMLVADVKDLLRQATTENSHYYTASVLRRVLAELERLEEIEWRMEGLEK